jgi:hypothetical protein
VNDPTLFFQASYDTVLILTSILMFGLPAVYTYTQQVGPLVPKSIA